MHRVDASSITGELRVLERLAAPGLGRAPTSAPPGMEPLAQRLERSDTLEVQWLASELARQAGSQAIGEGAERGRRCPITCDLDYHRVVVDGNGWRLVLMYDGERFVVTYDGDFDLVVARVRALAERLESILAMLSRDASDAWACSPAPRPAAPSDLYLRS